MTLWSIINNPGSLSTIGESARGIILENGDLFVENFSNGTIHNDILKILYDRGILEGSLKRSWTRQTPDISGFLTVQRYKDANILCIGESNRNLYIKSDYDVKIHLYRPFLERASEKNPGIEFIDKLIKIRAPFSGDDSVTIKYHPDK